jgi:hypothetical protein
MRYFIVILLIVLGKLTYCQQDTIVTIYLPEFTRSISINDDTVRQTYCYNKKNDLVDLYNSESIDEVDFCDCFIILRKDIIDSSKFDSNKIVTDNGEIKKVRFYYSSRKDSILRKIANYKKLSNNNWLLTVYKNNSVDKQELLIENRKEIQATDDMIFTRPYPPFNEIEYLIYYYEILKK